MNTKSNERINILFYWIIPLSLGVIQSLFNLFFDILPWRISLVDGMIFGFLLGALSIAIWYVVKYNKAVEDNILQNITTHAVAASVITFFWVYTGGFLSDFILQSNEYSMYLSTSVKGRIIIGYFYYLFLALLLYLFIYYRDNQEKKLKEHELIRQVRDAELQTLKSQINPHFLFNSLNSIASLTISDPEKAHEMVIALSDFLRYALRFQKNDKVKLEEELAHLLLYLKIEKIRFGEKLIYNFDVEKACLNLLLPNLLLQPLFENAVKYGVYEASEPVNISLAGKIAGGMLELILANDYDPEAIPRKGEGIGLKNIRERLLLTYQSNQLIKIVKLERQFIVTITLPIEEIS